MEDGAVRKEATYKHETGFTLVELAVVMIVIGLLIGGVLKGQELVANAEVTATIKQIKEIDAATSTFQDKYDAFPGDMIPTIAAVRIPNCIAYPCNQAGGDSNGRLDASWPCCAWGNALFWVHLAKADLITGIQAINAPTCSLSEWGCIYYGAEVGGGFFAAWWDGGPLAGHPAARQGHYLTLTANAEAAISPTVITPNQAFKIDNKLDDGTGNTGSVFSMTDGAGLCSDGGVYQEANDANICGMYIRFHN